MSQQKQQMKQEISHNQSDAKVATYPLVKQPIINIKQGERLTPEEIKQTVLLQNGAGTTNLPSNVQVTGKL